MLRQTGINPRHHVVQYAFLAQIIEKIMEMPLVKFEGFVAGACRFVKKLAAAWHCRFVSSAMQNQHGKFYGRKLPLQMFIGTHQSSNCCSWLCFIGNQWIGIENTYSLAIA